jgi:transcriptional regulator with PAS, ATPase and Fis domain
VVALTIPPLSDRKDDLPLLVQYFVKKFSALMQKSIRTVSPGYMDILMNYDFPGNVRELENIIERGVALATGDTLEPSLLPEDLRGMMMTTFRKHDDRLPTLAEQEKAYIEWVLAEAGDNKTLAAQILSIDRVSLWRKLKKYDLDTGDE